MVVARIDEHGVRRNAGQSRDALAYSGREVGAGKDEVRRNDREPRGAVVDDERLCDERVVRRPRRHPCEGPSSRAAGRTAE